MYRITSGIDPLGSCPSDLYLACSKLLDSYNAKGPFYQKQTDMHICHIRDHKEQTVLSQRGSQRPAVKQSVPVYKATEMPQFSYVLIILAHL